MAAITSTTKGSNANPHKSGDIVINGSTFTGTFDQLCLLKQQVEQLMLSMAGAG